MALRRGIAGCHVLTGRSEIDVDPAGHLAVSGRVDGRDFAVDGILRRTAGKSFHYAGQMVVLDCLDAVRRHLPLYDSQSRFSAPNFAPVGAGSNWYP